MEDLKPFHDAIEKLDSIKSSLRQKGNSLYDVGNSVLGDYMYDVANDIANQRLVLDDWLSKSVTSMLKNAQENTASILQAALAGATLERQSK